MIRNSHCLRRCCLAFDRAEVERWIGQRPRFFQGSGGTRYSFANWSDAGALRHTITAPADASTYTVNFTTQFRLTTTVSPLNSGSISANPSSADGYYARGTSVELTANPNSGYSLSSWSGNLAMTANPQTIIVSEPRHVTATFRISGTTPSRIKPQFPGSLRPKRGRGIRGD